MKYLYVMRHAKSDWTTDATDIERPLNKRGRRNAKRIGLFLKEKEENIEMFVSSPALRAFATAEIVAECCGFNKEVGINDEFYFGTENSVMQEIMKLPCNVSRAIVFGHNPVWENIVGQYVDGFSVEKFPTAAIAKIKFDVQDWQKLENKTGNLQWFVVPKSLD